ncbi:ornithine carbamoyltransferase, catabolic [Iodidimonas nitroreducens]|uniref:Ornithine carbamoyltransferase n=1 Tax=Iodidimonas nitroreducens TaxID=1236968 RepID=A0A5A7N5L0_9PROT|nr:ornithine carbamoyltransferase [Iodidimonas nitroreducens]GAK32514.1 ornithine carbamoyltransferase [alpha proteobacterium Q-1]GER02710.1 ornithine carbamoyltransferase, catabolic [Iodidimonas nitroreducens]
MTASATPAGLRHFLDLDRMGSQTLRQILDHARQMKARRGGMPRGAVDRDAPLSGDILLMIFQKSSTRTRISFEVAMRQLGGAASDLDGSRLQLGRGESIADTAHVLSAYGDAIVLRTDQHSNLTEMAQHATIPVINALTDHSHPCQLMADMLTIEEAKGPIRGQSVAWLGDGNNVASSLIHAAQRFGFRLRLACPPGHQPNPAVIEAALAEGADVGLCDDPIEAVAGASALYTDTWSSMGQERAPEELAPFEPYRVTSELLAKAAPDAIFMHCLPAHRGEEVTDAVIDGPQSVVWAQAENRLHAQKAILAWCLARG